jgi:hypothetical protein
MLAGDRQSHISRDLSISRRRAIAIRDKAVDAAKLDGTHPLPALPAELVPSESEGVLFLRSYTNLARRLSLNGLTPERLISQVANRRYGYPLGRFGTLDCWPDE